MFGIKLPCPNIVYYHGNLEKHFILIKPGDPTWASSKEQIVQCAKHR